MSARPGWSMVSPPILRGKAATQRHDASGWTVEHCGHPTALWPYLLRHDERPETIVVAPNGYGFRRVHDAQLAAEQLHAGSVDLVEVGWSSQYRTNIAQVSR